MNVISSKFKIPGLHPDSGWVYAFGGKHTGEFGNPGHESTVDSSDSIESGSGFAARILRSMNIQNREAYLTRQVHGNRVYALEDNSISSGEVSQIEADAIVTNLPGKPIAALTADCVPIVLIDAGQRAAGVVHAGRRGTARRVLSQAVRRMKERYGAENETLRMGIGPAIGPCCYEVGGECAEEFRDNPAGWRRWARPGENGKFFLDLIAANREEAMDEGLLEKNVFLSGKCTACENGLFYSWRKEKTCGRNVALVMLR